MLLLYHYFFIIFPEQDKSQEGKSISTWQLLTIPSVFIVGTFLKELYGRS